MANAALLVYAAPRKSLAITGRGIDPAIHLSADDIAAAAAADDYRPAGRSFDQLLGDLADWSPKTRALAANAIGELKPGDAQMKKVRALATDPGTTPAARAAACMALGKLRDGDSARLLAGLLTDPDSMVRYFAAEALRYLPAPAQRAVLDDILRAAASTAKPLFPLDPDDPLHFAHGRLAMLLFYSGKAYGPKGILHSSVEGVDRALLYPAIRAIAQTPIGLARSTLHQTYQNLTKEDVLELADAITESVIERAPSDRMFSSGVRNSGVQALATHRIAEAIPAAVLYTMDDPKGMTPLQEALARFGGAVKTIPHQPDAIQFLEMDFNRKVAGVAETLAALRADTAPGPVIHLKHINSVSADPATVILPAAATALQVDAHSHLKGPHIFTWRKLDGPGDVTFSDNNTPTAAKTTATFDGTPGKYTLEVSMTDEHRLTSVTASVTIGVGSR
jgi:hypothetical protein